MNITKVGRKAPVSPRIMVFTKRFWITVQWGWFRWTFYRYDCVAKWGWSYGPICIIREL